MFQKLNWSVVTGGMVRVVFFVVLAIPVEVDTWPSLRVVTFEVVHATSRDVV